MGQLIGRQIDPGQPGQGGDIVGTQGHGRHPMRSFEVRLGRVEAKGMMWGRRQKGHHSWTTDSR